MIRKEKNPNVEHLANLVFAVLSAAKQGTIVPWSAIEAVAPDRSRYVDPEFRHGITKARRRMERDRQIVSWGLPGIGIRLLTDREVNEEHLPRRQRRAKRQINRGLREASTIDVSKLTLPGRRLLVAQEQAMREHRLQIGRSLRNNSDIKPTPTLPRRAVPS